MELKVNIEKLAVRHALDIYEIMQMVLKREKRLNQGKEHFWVIALNNASKILNLELVSLGSVSNTIVKPMEVLSIPLQKRAVGVILVHNHPSGNLTPSEEDKDLTDRLIQACKLMNTPVLDHVIITERSYYSFKESGLLERLEASNRYVLPYELERQYHEEMEAEIRAIKQESKEQIAKSLEEGVKLGKEEIAKNMLASKLDIALIAQVTGLSIQQIEQLE